MFSPGNEWMIEEFQKRSRRKMECTFTIRSTLKIKFIQNKLSKR